MKNKLMAFLQNQMIKTFLRGQKIKTFLRDQDGLTIVEYAVAAGLITATVAGAFFALGGSVQTIIATVNGYVNGVGVVAP